MQVPVGIPQVLFQSCHLFNDIRRTDDQRGVFGELSFATSDTTELSIGARWYDIKVDFEGSANSLFIMVLVRQTLNNLVLTYQHSMLQALRMDTLIKLKLTVLLEKLRILETK